MKRTPQTRRRSAAAAVEFAVLLPFLAFLCVITTDWARLFYYTISVEACARNGALYASDADIALKSPYGNVHDAALAEAPYLDPNTSVTTTQTVDSASNPAVICTVTTPFNTITNFPGVPNPQTLTRSVQMRMAVLAIR
jgi:Flp pilus assembly protein TadG